MYNLPTIKVESKHTFLLLIFRFFLVNNERQINGCESDHDSVNCGEVNDSDNFKFSDVIV